MQPYPPMGPGGGPFPGQPGSYGYPYPPAPPSGPRTLGTLSIVFGAIGSASGLFGALGGSSGFAAMMLRNLPRNAGAAAMEDYLAAIRIPSLIQSLLFLGMSIWLILLGMGQRRYKASAARQSVTWGVLALVILVGMVVVHFTVIGPAATRMMEEMMRHTGARNPLGPFMSIAGLGGLLFYAPYPIILIVAFRKPETVAAMTT